jgi:hypothetical protein
MRSTSLNVQVASVQAPTPTTRLALSQVYSQVLSLQSGLSAEALRSDLSQVKEHVEAFQSGLSAEDACSALSQEQTQVLEFRSG